jgi:hypothetical protein
MSVFFCLVLSCVVCFAMGRVYAYRILSVVNTIRIDHQNFFFTAENDDEGEMNCEEVIAYCVCVCVCVKVGGVWFWCVLVSTDTFQSHTFL